jgi:hypothetical protein
VPPFQLYPRHRQPAPLPQCSLLARAILLGCLLGAATAAEPPVDFNRDVRSILAEKCFACHGPDAGKRKSRLRLDDEAVAKSDLGGRRAIVPARPEESELLRRVLDADPGERMPPPDSGKSLAPGEIATLRRWIEAGAPWAPHWAYLPPRRVPPPAVADASWPRGEIDRYILARLEREGQPPSPDADRVTLVRRLSFDLVGLPPGPQEVDAFVAGPDSQVAFEQLVDRLLASEAFGERLAVFWLDLVRYADTVGYHGDQDHNASPYRDYVIDAFHRNVPFDRFTREQLAGDLVPGSGTDEKIASAYNRLLQTSHEGGVQPKEYLTIYAADRVRNVSTVWLGATMGCAQCHDHKYDPFTMKDFYSLEAFFADLDETAHFRDGTNDLPTKRSPEIAVHTRRERERLAALQTEIERLEAVAPASTSGDAGSAGALREQLDRLRAEHEALAKATRRVMVSRSIEPRVTRILPRGNWLDDSGEVVAPAVPRSLGQLDVRDRRATRLDLANWLVDAERGAGGLTARVLSNRLWSLFFGSGLASNLEDFGVQTGPPSHPELLDHLALELIDGRWDLKRLIRQIVLSRTYRQSSAAGPSLLARDPANRLLARQGRFRLPAEMVRDNALAVSGLLVREVGGASVKPYQPLGYYRHLNFPKREYEAHADARQWRRGVYVHWQRQFLHPMLKAFDAPRREECTAERPRSSTPLGALVLLNDPTFVEAARVLAQRVLEGGGDADAPRLDFAFRLALSRRPDESERSVLLRLLQGSRERYRNAAGEARKLVSTGQAPVPEQLDAIEHASWTAICRALLNLGETMTRS